MDDSTRKKFKDDLRSGYSADAAGQRARITKEEAYYEADRVRRDDFSQMMQDTFLKRSESSGEIPFGAIALVILGIVIWSNIDVIAQWALIIGLFIMMLISMPATTKGMWTFVQLLWLTVGTALVAGLVLLFRNGAPEVNGTGILGAHLPQLATGSKWADAAVIGFCIAMLVYALPALRDGLFRWLSGFGMTQVLRVYVASTFSAWPVRLLAQIFLLPLTAALVWGLLVWPDGSWVLRVLFCYGLLLIAFAEMWVWRLTSTPEVFGAYFGHIDVRSYKAAWEKYGGKWKDL